MKTENMTPLDYFAAHVMPAVYSRYPKPEYLSDSDHARYVAAEAYKIAEAAIQVRARKSMALSSSD